MLQSADSFRRVVSVLAATCEGAIDTQNLIRQDLPLMKSRDQVASIQTLLLEEAARRAPDVSFVHTVPGVVKSGIMRNVEMSGMGITLAIARLLGPLIQTPPAECGERHVFVATSAVYPPQQAGDSSVGVSLDGKLTVAKGSNGDVGSGMYTVSNKGESASSKVVELLAGFREDGTAKKVWDFVAADFKRITGKEVTPWSG
jgi:hypothetical protein